MSVLARCLLSLFLIYPQSTGSVAVVAACNATPVYEDITPPATRNIACIPVKSSFAGKQAVKTDTASVTGDFCSHIGTVSQAVPAATATLLYVAGSSAAYENQGTACSADENKLLIKSVCKPAQKS